MLKKILAIACTLFMLCGMTAFALEADTVLEPTVVNGDFSDGTTMWFSANKGKATAGKEDYAGTLQVTATEANQSKAHVYQNITFDFEPGVSYTLEAKACNPTVEGQRATGFLGAANAATGGFLKTTANADCKATINSETWATYTVTFTVPANEDGSTALSKLRIWLANSTTTPIYFDDIKIYEAPLLLNGDFENGNPPSYSNGGGTTIKRVENDPTNAHTGNAYLLFDKAVNGYCSFALTCEANTTYKLSYWFRYNKDATHSGAAFPKVGVKTADGAAEYILDARTSANFHNTIGNISGANLGQNQWIKRTHYFTTPADTTTVRILIWGSGVANSLCYYDDITVERAVNEVELHNYPLDNGTDITDLSACGGKTLYIKGRFIAETPTDTAMLITVVFDESKGKKQLEYLDVKPVTGTQTLIDSRISGYASFEGKAVEAYIWDSTTGLDALAKKVRRSQSATQ